MPYVPAGVPQALDVTDIGVVDVYHSPSVFVNNVPVALWQSPVLGDSGLSAIVVPPDKPVLDYAPNPAQVDNFNGGQSAAQLDPTTGPIIGGPGTGGQGTIAEGDMPGTGTSDPNSNGTSTVADSPLNVSGADIWSRLEQNLTQALTDANAGKWKALTQKGDPPFTSPMNQNILGCFVDMGFTRASIDANPEFVKRGWVGDTVPWCAAFAGSTLKKSGAKYLPRNLLARNYADAPYAPNLQGDSSQWRRNDVVYCSFSHVSFLYSLDLKNSIAYIRGGNQSRNVTIMGVPIQKLAFVGRNWTVPAEYDKTPIQQ